MNVTFFAFLPQDSAKFLRKQSILRKYSNPHIHYLIPCGTNDGPTEFGTPYLTVELWYR